MYGNARRQLMQEYVQKSRTTTLPLSDARVSGLELSQPVAPASSGMSPSMTGAPDDAFADIIAPPPSAASGFAAIIIAPPASGVAAIIAAPAAAGFATAVAASAFRRFPASATSAGFCTYSAGNRRAKFCTFGRSLKAMYGWSG